MPRVTGSIECCGLNELADICEGLTVAHTISTVSSGKMVAFLVFTDTERHDFEFGEDLAAEIRKHKLGVVTQAEADKTNPNSGRMLRAWLWSPDYTAIMNYVSEERKNGRLKPSGLQPPVAKGPLQSPVIVGRASDIFARPPSNWARSISYFGSPFPRGRGRDEAD